MGEDGELVCGLATALEVTSFIQSHALRTKHARERPGGTVFLPNSAEEEESAPKPPGTRQEHMHFPACVFPYTVDNVNTQRNGRTDYA